MAKIDEKLLMESLDALLAGDKKTAERKFKNAWDRIANECFNIMESEEIADAEEDKELADNVDDALDTEVEETDNCLDDVLAAVSELESKYPTEMTDEISARFDELKNKIDDLRLAEDDECKESKDEALLALDDLKADFEMADAMTDDVVDIFNEIGEKLSDDECCGDAEDMDDDLSADLDMDDMGEEEKDDVVEEGKDPELSEDGEQDFDLDDDAEKINEPAQEGEPAPAPAEDDDLEAGLDERSSEDLILDAKANTKELMDELDALEDKSEAEPDSVEESFKQFKGNTLKKEETGVSKQSLNMPRPARIDSDAKLGASSANTNGKRINTRTKPFGNVPEEQKAKWNPIPKKAPKAASAKSVMG